MKQTQWKEIKLKMRTQWEKTQKRKTQINYNFRLKWKKEKKMFCGFLHTKWKANKAKRANRLDRKKPSNRANNMKNNLFELPVELASEWASKRSRKMSSSADRIIMIYVVCACYFLNIVHRLIDWFAHA